MKQREQPKSKEATRAPDRKRKLLMSKMTSMKVRNGKQKMSQLTGTQLTSSLSFATLKKNSSSTGQLVRIAQVSGPNPRMLYCHATQRVGVTT